jgi:hypothetical protein
VALLWLEKGAETPAMNTKSREVIFGDKDLSAGGLNPNS